MKGLQKLSNLLESCDFPAFWTAAASEKATLSKVGDFDEAIRTFMLRTIAITYSSISKADLAKSLNVSSVPASKYIASTDGDKVTFVPNEQNQFKPKASEQLEDYNTVFTKVLYSSAITSSAE